MGAAFISPLGNNALLGLLAGLAVLSMAYAQSEIGLIRLPLFERRAQVPERWRRTLGVERGLFVYGLILGAAFLTFVISPITYVAFGLALLSASPMEGAIIGATYGVVRVVPILSGVIGVAVAGEAPAARLRWGLVLLPYRGASVMVLAAAAGALFTTSIMS